MLTKHAITLTIAACLSNTGLAAGPLDQAERSHSIAARMQAETSKAADPDAPAPLPVPSDISLAELARRLALGQAHSAEKHLSSALDPAALTALAQQMGCRDIVGVQPFGFPLDQTQPTVLSGAHLLARCPDRAYATITAMSMAGKTGKRVTLDPQAFRHTVDGRPARRLYYKAPSGRQKETLTFVDGDYVYALEYWSLDDSQQSAMVGMRRMETLTLPQQAGQK